MPDNSKADVCRLLTERLYTKPNVKWDGFQFQFEASCVSSHNWRTVIQRNSLSVDDNIYASLSAVEHFSEGINGFHSRHAKPF